MILETEDLMRAQPDEGLVSLKEKSLTELRTRSIEAHDRLATLNPMLDIIYFALVKLACIQMRSLKKYIVKKIESFFKQKISHKKY